MTTDMARSGRRSWVGSVRWFARVLALLLVGIVLAFLMGEGVAVDHLTPVEGRCSVCPGCST